MAMAVDEPDQTRDLDVELDSTRNGLYPNFFVSHLRSIRSSLPSRTPRNDTILRVDDAWAVFLLARFSYHIPAILAFRQSHQSCSCLHEQQA
jgi:hypothetical protein